MRLADFEKRWFDVVARALLPRGMFGGAVDDVDAGARFAADTALGPWVASLGMRATLWLVWLAPLVVGPRRRTFGGLDDDERAEAFTRLLASPRYFVRAAANLFKVTVCMIVLGDVRFLEHVGAYGLGDVDPPLVAPGTLAPHARREIAQ